MAARALAQNRIAQLPEQLKTTLAVFAVLLAFRFVLVNWHQNPVRFHSLVAIVNAKQSCATFLDVLNWGKEALNSALVRISKRS